MYDATTGATFAGWFDCGDRVCVSDAARRVQVHSGGGLCSDGVDADAVTDHFYVKFQYFCKVTISDFCY